MSECISKRKVLRIVILCLLFVAVCVIGSVFSASITAHLLYRDYERSKNVFVPVPIQVDNPSQSVTRQHQNLPDLVYAAEMAVRNVVKVNVLRSVATESPKQSWIETLLRPSVPAFSQHNFYGGGAGVIIGREGYIVTNNHVVRDVSTIKVTLNDGREFTAEVIGADDISDLALLKIDACDLPEFIWGDSESVHIGEWVLAIGSPYGLKNTVTAGIISAKGRDLSLLNQQFQNGYIQTDAAVNAGNSGGGLVNMNGELIGIITTIKSYTGRSTGYSFAIPSSIVKMVVSDIQNFGTVRYSVLGMSFLEINDHSVRKINGMRAKQGLYITAVDSTGQAHAAGVQLQDVVVGLNGGAITSAESMMQELLKYKPQDTLVLQVKRQEKVYPIRIQL